MSSNRPELQISAILRIVVLAVLATGVAAVGQAQMQFYNAWAGFNAAAPGTTLVTFEAGVITDAVNGASFPELLTSTSNNGVFSPGDIPDGIAFGNLGSTDLYLVGPGYTGWGPAGGFTSKVLFPASDTSSLVISFPVPVDAVAFDAYAESDSGFTVLVYGGPSEALLQTVNDTAGGDSPGFFGVVSQIPITQVVLSAPVGGSGNWEAADNVAFRAFAPPDPIPALGGPSLALLALLLAAAAVMVLRRSLA